MSIDKIIDRVKKMLALGNDSGASEQERETALRMAFSLLAKHNLSMADLPADQVEVREEQSVTICGDRWIRTLSNDVAKLFFCNYYFTRTAVSGKEMHTFIGRQSNVLTARYMTEYLVKSIRKEASRLFGSPTSPNGRSFGVGSTNSIHKRINIMLEQSGEQQSGTSTALAIIHLRTSEKEANSMWLADKGVALTTGKVRADNALRTTGFYAGKEFGNKVSLNQQVGNTSSSLLKLGK